jgi:hypothetical protein
MPKGQEPSSRVSKAPCPRRGMLGSDLPAVRPYDEGQVAADAQAVATTTHLCVVAAMVDEPDEGAVRAGADGDRRLRFLARRAGGHVTDETLGELSVCIPARLRWASLAKLEEFDPVPGFPLLPAC